MGHGNSLAVCYNIIDYGFKTNQTQVKIAVCNAKIWQNRRELLVKLLCESSDLCYAC